MPRRDQAKENRLRRNDARAPSAATTVGGRRIPPAAGAAARRLVARGRARGHRGRSGAATRGVGGGANGEHFAPGLGAQGAPEMVVGKPLLFAARSSPAILPEDFEGQRSQPIQPEVKNVPPGRGACAAHHAPTIGHVDLAGGNHLHVGVRMGEMASIMPKLHRHSSAGRKHLPQKRGEEDPSVRGSSRPHDELTDVILSMGQRLEAWRHSPRRAVTCAAPVFVARAAHDRRRGGRTRRKPWWRPHAPRASIRRPPRRPRRIAAPLLRRELLGLHHRVLPLLCGGEPTNRRH